MGRLSETTRDQLFTDLAVAFIVIPIACGGRPPPPVVPVADTQTVESRAVATASRAKLTTLEELARPLDLGSDAVFRLGALSWDDEGRYRAPLAMRRVLSQWKSEFRGFSELDVEYEYVFADSSESIPASVRLAWTAYVNVGHGDTNASAPDVRGPLATVGLELVDRERDVEHYSTPSTSKKVVQGLELSGAPLPSDHPFSSYFSFVWSAKLSHAGEPPTYAELTQVLPSFAVMDAISAILGTRPIVHATDAGATIRHRSFRLMLDQPSDRTGLVRAFEALGFSLEGEDVEGTKMGATLVQAADGHIHVAAGKPAVIHVNVSLLDAQGAVTVAISNDV
jgi:hypothetical protein